MVEEEEEEVNDDTGTKGSKMSKADILEYKVT